MAFKSKILFKVFVCLLIASLLFISLRLYFHLTDDFRLGNIQYKMPYQSNWEIKEDREQLQDIKKILSQPYKYIGKGAQSYAFQSLDHLYVLKFFKFKHLTPNWFVELFPPFPPFSTYRENQAIRKRKKLYSVFEGYHLAYETHQEASGLIYIHLNSTHDLQQHVTVIDKIGLKRIIDLDAMPFILQYKAKTTRQLIVEALTQDNVGQVEYYIRQIIDLYLAEYQKGIYDKDHGVMHNTGFIGLAPIHLDVGKLVKEKLLAEPAIWQKDLEHVAWKFHTWFKHHYPNYHAQIMAYIENQLSVIFERPFTFETSIPPPRKHR